MSARKRKMTIGGMAFVCERPGLWISENRKFCLWKALRGTRQADWNLCRTGPGAEPSKRRAGAWQSWAIQGNEIAAGALWMTDPGIARAVADAMIVALASLVACSSGAPEPKVCREAHEHYTECGILFSSEPACDGIEYCRSQCAAGAECEDIALGLLGAPSVFGACAATCGSQ